MTIVAKCNIFINHPKTFNVYVFTSLTCSEIYHSNKQMKLPELTHFVGRSVRWARSINDEYPRYSVKDKLGFSVPISTLSFGVLIYYTIYFPNFFVKYSPCLFSWLWQLAKIKPIFLFILQTKDLLVKRRRPFLSAYSNSNQPIFLISNI